jgi:hypothetical protein
MTVDPVNNESVVRSMAEFEWFPSTPLSQSDCGDSRELHRARRIYSRLKSPLRTETVPDRTT